MIEPFSIDNAGPLTGNLKITESGCWEWTRGRFSNGYGRLYTGGKGFKTHRISFEYFVRPLVPGEYVCHHCDNPPCCNPAHLFAGTAKDNWRDMLSKGRGRFASGDNHGLRKNPEAAMRGDSHIFAKLRCSDIPGIRERIAAGERHGKIAADFGVSREAITRIKSKKAWAHIP